MSKRKSDTIEIRKGAGSESAYIAGTRVKVLDIARMYAVMLDELVIERLQRALPHLTPYQLAKAIEYWRSNRKEIEREIAEEEEVLAKIPTA